MPSPQLQIIRKSSFRATPWKNGGGITHEAIRVPASGDSFHWRVSVAHIDVSGPFSDFAAYRRHMVLLRGLGIELRFGGGTDVPTGAGAPTGVGAPAGAHASTAANVVGETSRALRRVGDLVEFDGAVSTYCELLNGPCVDLNLMVAKSNLASARVERLTESLMVAAGPDETVLVFPIDGGLTMEIAAGETVTLEPWDLAVLSACGGRLGNPESAASPPQPSVFLATLKLMSGE